MSAAFDLEQLLRDLALETVLDNPRVTIIEDETEVTALIELQREDRRLAAAEAAIKKRREGIRALIRESVVPGDEALVVVTGPERDTPRTVAKVVYPEPTVRVNVEYVKTTYPFPEHREFYIVTESTPRLLVQEAED